MQNTNAQLLLSQNTRTKLPAPCNFLHSLPLPLSSVYPEEQPWPSVAPCWCLASPASQPASWHSRKPSPPPAPLSDCMLAPSRGAMQPRNPAPGLGTPLRFETSCAGGASEALPALRRALAGAVGCQQPNAGAEQYGTGLSGLLQLAGCNHRRSARLRRTLGRERRRGVARNGCGCRRPWHGGRA